MASQVKGHPEASHAGKEAYLLLNAERSYFSRYGSGFFHFRTGM
jgi:hypothetical protein